MSKISKKNSPKKCVFESTSAIESAKDSFISAIVEDSVYYVEVFGVEIPQFNELKEYMEKFNYKFVCFGTSEEELCSCEKHLTAIFNLKHK